MGRTWISVKVELVQGHGEILWPRPGRVFAASRSQTFEELAESIDNAFARWDLAHLHEFELGGSTRVGPRSWNDDDPPELDSFTTKLGRLSLGETFAYVFDFGDMWAHLCTVGPARIDPLENLGVVPDTPRAYWG